MENKVPYVSVCSKNAKEGFAYQTNWLNPKQLVVSVMWMNQKVASREDEEFIVLIEERKKITVAIDQKELNMSTMNAKSLPNSYVGWSVNVNVNGCIVGSVTTRMFILEVEDTEDKTQKAASLSDCIDCTGTALHESFKKS